MAPAARAGEAGRPDAAGAAPVGIVGAGPVGLALALGLARHGVRSVLLERDAGLSRYSKAPGIHVRTREALRRWGVDEALLAEGTLLRELVLHRVPGERPLVVADLGVLADEAERPGLLVLEQARTEAVLLDAVRASGMCDVRFGAEVVALDQDEHEVRLGVRRGVDGGRAEVGPGADGGGRVVRTAFAVACDGASSTVRELLGLPFPGRTYALQPVLADVRLDDARDRLPWPRLRLDRGGLTAAFRLRAGLWRVIRLAPGEAPAGEAGPAPGRIEALAAEALGRGPVEVTWASRFRIHQRAVPSFRRGRVLLAGDAAHVHSPVGGQGMNGGIQDAEALAWRLAAALRGGSVGRLLDSYDVERRAVVVGSTSRYTDVLTRLFLLAPAPVRAAAFRAARLTLAVPASRRRALRRAAMLDLRPGSSPLLVGTHPASGSRVPDPLLMTPGGGPVRLHALLGSGAAVLVVGGAPRPQEPIGGGELGTALGAPPAVVRIGGGGHRDPSGLVRALLRGRDGYVVVRPDGLVGWAGADPAGLRAALPLALGLH